jgi:hypothetical protein
MRYLVAKDIKSETKVSKNIYIYDFFFILIYMSVSLVLANLVHPSLKIVFFIYSLGMAVFLTAKSYYNKKRRNYESVMIMLRRDKESYSPVLNKSRRRERIEKEEGYQMKKGKKVKKSILEKIDVAEYLEEGYYRMKDGTYMNLVQINSKDLINSSADEVEYDCMKFAKLYKLFENDFPFVTQLSQHREIILKICASKIDAFISFTVDKSKVTICSSNILSIDVYPSNKDPYVSTTFPITRRILSTKINFFLISSIPTSFT